jgi:FdhD protein
MRSYLKVRAGRVDEVVGAVVKEQPLTIYVDGERFLTLLCTPVQVEALVLGYLWMEKVIAGLDDVVRLDVSTVDGRADVILTQTVTLPTERILTSGCGGGITFRIDHRLFPRLHSSQRVRPEQIAARMKDLFAAAVHYQQSRGIHGAALSDGDCLLVVAEDVGRHNAVDKVKGEALVRGIATEDRILLSTGRVSSEMLLKAARMGVPIVASRTSPTEMAVALAEQLNITVCGYVRGDSLNLYAGEGVAVGDAVGGSRG